MKKAKKNQPDEVLPGEAEGADEKRNKLAIQVPLWKETARMKLDELAEIVKNTAPPAFLNELKKLRKETK